MTLKEMKIKTFSLIEEYYPEEKGLAEDEDVLNKINGVVNQIQLDLMKYRKISAKMEYDLKDGNILELSEISGLYQLNKILDEEYNSIQYDIIGDYEIVFQDKDKLINIYYYKYPELVQTIFTANGDMSKEEVSERYDNSFEFELGPDLLEIMPYGIAADLLKMDMISNYGEYFYKRYQEMKNMIDPRINVEMITIEGGSDV